MKEKHFRWCITTDDDGAGTPTVAVQSFEVHTAHTHTHTHTRARAPAPSPVLKASPFMGGLARPTTANTGLGGRWASWPVLAVVGHTRSHSRFVAKILSQAKRPVLRSTTLGRGLLGVDLLSMAALVACPSAKPTGPRGAVNGWYCWLGQKLQGSPSLHCGWSLPPCSSTLH